MSRVGVILVQIRGEEHSVERFVGTLSDVGAVGLFDENGASYRDVNTQVCFTCIT